MIASRFQVTPHRRGFGLVEMAVSGVLFATMVLVAAQLMAWVATDRKAVSHREGATRLVRNVMERILARPFPEISTEGLAPLALSAIESKPYPPGSLLIEVTQTRVTGGRAQKKILVELRWPEKSGVAGSPVRLVAWTFERKGTQP